MFHFDCRYFRNDRPCLPHKQAGVLCPDCDRYSPVTQRLLLIKLAARGDVLRTTSLLEPLRKEYPEAELIWLVAPTSAPLLDNIPEIDQVWKCNAPNLARLHVDEFDIVVNLDLSPESAALATLAKAPVKFGYGLNNRGRVFPFDAHGEKVLAMSLRDDLKKENQQTYQQLMMEILELEGAPGKIQVNLTDEERRFARKFSDNLGIQRDRPVFGINVGAGGRWEKKIWKPYHMLEFLKLLYSEFESPIVLLGGESEAGTIDWIQKGAAIPLYSSGTANSLREFMAIVGLCDCVISGDTMALHIALGLDKTVVGLFGPTSAPEVEMYGQGEKLTADMECLCCYRETCDKKEDCMSLLSPERVFQTVVRLMKTNEEYKS